MTSVEKTTEALKDESDSVSSASDSECMSATARASAIDLGKVNLGNLESIQSNLDLSASELGTSADSDSGSNDLSQVDSLSSAPPVLAPSSEASMEEYYQLQTRLFCLTLGFTAFVFPFVCGFYSWQIALDYLLGSCAGVVYLRMLARNVSTLGRDRKKNSSIGRLAVFAGVMIVALRWDQVDVIPVFLGFLTYKAAIIAFVLWTSVMPERKAV